ncbi:hypothetical protein OPT61_g9259 [Boeremia exigua]|uniref:Uncharacterized protein n=1 Tax=Boeremia exigua TaxID=749465 RepID=A0ACC2HUV2_9PLEO|nr:hypothetical protein OPT61_g9259 [Boeremia exigua]
MHTPGIDPLDLQSGESRVVKEKPETERIMEPAGHDQEQGTPPGLLAEGSLLLADQESAAGNSKIPILVLSRCVFMNRAVRGGADGEGEQKTR